MRKYAAEFIGTFFLVLTVGSTGIAVGSGVIPPLAIGSVLMVMIYAGGHVSGAHYNPAVTVGVFLRGRCAAADVVPYWVAQLAGAVAAAAIVLFLKTAEAVRLDAAVPAAVAAEFLFTFALVYVVLNVATAKSTDGNSVPSASQSASRSWPGRSPLGTSPVAPSIPPSPLAPWSWECCRGGTSGSTSRRNSPAVQPRRWYSGPSTPKIGN